MRHKKNRLLELETGPKTRKVFVRQLLTNLVKNGKTTTTPKRAKVLKSEADAFFANLVRLNKKLEEKDARRECIRYIKARIYGEPEGKKVLNVLLPKYLEAGSTTSFVADYKLGHRVGDGVQKIMLKLL
jgi:ribosomal protein L17